MKRVALCSIRFASILRAALGAVLGLTLFFFDVEAATVAERENNSIRTIDVERVMAANYYDLLGLTRDEANEKPKIDAALRKLRVRFHPDRAHGDAAIPRSQRELATTEEANKLFSRILEAADVLSDPQKRRAYDGARGGSRNSRNSEASDLPALNEAIVGHHLKDLRASKDIGHMLSWMVKSDLWHLYGREFHEALRRVALEAAALETSPNVASPTWRDRLPRLLQPASGDPWSSLAKMDLNDLMFLFDFRLSGRDLRALIFALAAERVDTMVSAAAIEHHRRLLMAVLDNSSTDFKPLMELPTFQRQFSPEFRQTFVHELPELMSATNRPSASSEVVLRSLLKMRLASVPPDKVFTQEIGFHVTVLTSRSWRQFDKKSVHAAEQKIVDLLRNNPTRAAEVMEYLNRFIEKNAFYPLIDVTPINGLREKLDPKSAAHAGRGSQAAGSALKSAWSWTRNKFAAKKLIECSVIFGR